MKKCTVVGVQIAPISNQPEKMIDKISKYIEKAYALYKPDLIIFPETITTGFSTNLSKEALWDIIDFIPGKLTGKISYYAKKFGIYIILPTYERGEERGDIYNSSVLIGSDGQIVGVYRKTHLFPVEREWVIPGNEAKVFDTPFGKIGMIICYDGDFPELSRILTLKGAEIITRPAALLRSCEIWDLTNKARAYDNHVYVIGVNTVGSDAGGNYYFGNSMIISPLAQKISQANSNECFVVANLEPESFEYVSYGTNASMKFHHIKDINKNIR